ncbi:MAG: response regulator [Planctomycetota bacterium]|nr:response regulator [Planctomycetota bacterium]
MKLLVADDDKVCRMILEKQLAKTRHEVQIVSDGEAALRALQAAHAPQVAILDWMMPGLSGPQVCRQVRARQGVPYTYLIICTARSRSEDLVAGLDAGADDYLIKPYEAEELLARLRVAERILRVQEELREHAEQMERMLKRHNLLGDALARRASPEDAVRAAPARDAQAAAPEAKPLVEGQLEYSERFAEVQALRRFEALVPRVFEQFDAPVRADGAERVRPGLPVYLAGTSVYVETLASWLDLRISLDAPTLAALFQQITQTLSMELDDQVQLAAEFANQFQRTLKAALESEGHRVLTPYVARMLRAGEAPETGEAGGGGGAYLWATSTLALQFETREHPAKARSTPAAKLEAGDVVVEALPDGREVPAPLSRIGALTAAQARNIRRWAEASKNPPAVKVLSPSAWARALELGSTPV